MARKNRDGSPVALFPFLAVLVCTMGALILLLIVTTRQLNQRMLESLRLQEVPSPEEGPILEPPPTNDEDSEEYERERQARLQRLADYGELKATWKARGEELARTRDRLRSEFEDSVAQSQTKDAERIARIGQFQNRISDLKQEIVRIEQEIEREESELLNVIEDLDLAEKKLDAVQTRRVEAQSKFAIVAYDGEYGTTRRPIFIECTGDGLKIMPEGIQLGIEELRGFDESFNPLLVIARELTLYWVDRGKLKPPKPDPAPPYVLLIVRPDGAVSFAVARKLLAEYKEPFGYELIDDQVPLMYPEVDPQALSIAKEALVLALETRANAIASMRPSGITNEQLAVSEKDRNPSAFWNDPAVELARTTPRTGTGAKAGPRTKGNSTREPRPAPLILDIANQKKFPVEGTIKKSKVDSRTIEKQAQRGSAQQEPGGTLGHPEGEGEELPDEVSLRENQEQVPGQGNHEQDPPLGSSPRGKAASRETRDQASNSRGRNEDEPSLKPEGRGSRRPRTSGQQLSRKRWGGGPAMGTIGLEKRVTVTIESDRLLVEDISVPLEEDMTNERLVELSLKALDQLSVDWGKPPARFHWVPAVRFRVFPGGNGFYQPLNAGLRKWGVYSSVDFEIGENRPGGRSGK